MSLTTNCESMTTSSNSLSMLPPTFILCDRCYWCATYFDRSRLHKEEKYEDNNGNKCPQCSNTDTLSSFYIYNESLTFNYTHKYGIELEFKPGFFNEKIRRRNER